MDDLSQFEQQVREKMALVAQLRRNQKEALHQEIEERAKRFSTFDEVEQRLMKSVICPRVERVARLFPNAVVTPAKGEMNAHIRCQFDKTPDFPATTSLTIAVSPDAELKNAIVTYELEILPVYFEFQGHDQFVVLIADVDDRSVAKWIESKLLEFMDAYVRLQTLDQYQVENQVVDPVCQLRFNRAAAEAEAVYEGRTYYFCLEECRQKFLADPPKYLAGPGPASPTSSPAELQAAELRRESDELKDLGHEIDDVKRRLRRTA
jgi:YHS domain-containing protein